MSSLLRRHAAVIAVSIQVDAAANAGSPPEVPSISGGGHGEPPTADEDMVATSQHDAAQPENKARRAALRKATNGQAMDPSSRARPPPTASEPGKAPQHRPVEQLEPPATETIKEWALRSSPRPLANAGLQINAKEAVRQLFEQRQKQICRTRSPERPDLKLSKEEALGWLLAYTHAGGASSKLRRGRSASSPASVRRRGSRNAMRCAARPGRSALEASERHICSGWVALCSGGDVHDHRERQQHRACTVIRSCLQPLANLFIELAFLMLKCHYHKCR